MSQWTIRLLRRCPTELRLSIAAWVFWISILLGVFSTVFIAKTAFEKILMAISWLAVTLTAADIILTADVRNEVAD